MKLETTLADWASHITAIKSYIFQSVFRNKFSRETRQVCMFNVTSLRLLNATMQHCKILNILRRVSTLTILDMIFSHKIYTFFFIRLKILEQH